MRCLAVLLVALGAAFALAGPAAAPAHACSASSEAVPTPNDRDDDCVDDRVDNCFGIANPDQIDTDRDGPGDRCDPDDDNDGKLDGEDNCRTVENPNQEKSDPASPYGDACRFDKGDGDGVIDAEDNCWRVVNPDQANLDLDAAGDVCDADDDQDGALDGSDNCPRNVNKEQTDTDKDGVGDACDPDTFAPSTFVAPPPVVAAEVDRKPARVTISLARTQGSGDAQGGMPAKVRCSEACSVSAELRIGSAVAKRLKLKAVVASGEAALDGAGTTYVFLDFTRPALKKLFRGKQVSATLTLKVLDAAGNASTARKGVRLAR